MYFVNDNHHGDGGGPGYREAVERALSGMDDGVLYVEDVNTSERSKAHTDRCYNRYLAGEAELRSPDEMRWGFFSGELRWPGLRDALTWDKTAIVDSRPGHRRPVYHGVGTPESSRVVLLEALADNRDSVARVDSGPVHESLADGAIVDLYDKPPGTQSPSDLDAKASAVRVRDDNWARYVREQVRDDAVDPDDAAVTIGGGHRLDARLERFVDLRRLNRSGVTREIGYTARQEAVRDELRAGDAGYALFGDPEAVADDLGPAGAQARVATVVAGLVDDDRFRRAAPGWAAETSDRVRTVATGDDPASERVGRLQTVARDALGRLVDLDAVRRTDVDVSPPDDPREPGAYVAETLGLDGAVAAAVDDLVDDGAVDPAQVAGLARLFNTTVSGLPRREFLDRTREELADRTPDDPGLHPVRRAAAYVRRGAAAVRSVVGPGSSDRDGDAEPTPAPLRDATRAGDVVAETAAVAAGPGPADEQALATVVAAADPDAAALARRPPLPADDRGSIVDQMRERSEPDGEAPARSAAVRDAGDRGA